VLPDCVRLTGADYLGTISSTVPEASAATNSHPRPNHAATRSQNPPKSVTCRGRGKVQPSPLVWPLHLHTPIAFRTPSSHPRAAHIAAARTSCAKAHVAKKLEIVQLWQCKHCRRVFTPAPPALRYKTYPLRVILDGVIPHNLGYSLPEVVAKLKSRHGYKVSPSTLASWMSEHHELTTYSRLRPGRQEQFDRNRRSAR
jgi:hypothetical protein